MGHPCGGMACCGVSEPKWGGRMSVCGVDEHEILNPEQGEGGVYPSARVAKQGVHTGDGGCGSESLVSTQGE